MSKRIIYTTYSEAGGIPVFSVHIEHPDGEDGRLSGEACYSSYYAAVGSLICSHPEVFGVEFRGVGGPGAPPRSADREAMEGLSR